MNYFETVYLKKLNRFGTNIQERIQGKKEYDFEYFKRKSPNKVNVSFQNIFCDGVLQNKTNSEKQVVDYLLVDKSIVFNDGDIIDTELFVDKKKQKWLVFHLDEYVSIGYNRYQVIELDREIEWIEDGKINRALTHITGSGANLRDKSITSKFTIQYDLAAVYLPNKILNLVMKTDPNFKKGTRVLIEDEIWKVTGMDKISVPGVSYVTLQEDYLDKMDDIDYADSKKLLDWSIQSTRGDVINVVIGASESIDFLCYYQGDLQEAAVNVAVKDNSIATFSNGHINGIAQGATEMIVSLEDSDEVQKVFFIEVSEEEQSNAAIVGPDYIKMLNTATYTLKKNEEEIGDFTIDLSNENAHLVSIEDESFVLEGKQIGTVEIIIKQNDEEICRKEISIKSIWIEG